MRRSPLGKITRFAPALFGLILFVADPAFALHRESPGAIRITKAGSHANSRGRSWGNWSAFVSSADLAFTGNTGQQAFVFKLFPWVCQNGNPTPENLAQCAVPPTPVIEQATSGVGDPAHPSIGLPSGVCTLNTQRACKSTSDCQTSGVDFGTCAINAQWIAFEADGAFNGGSGPGVGHRQVFLKNLLTDEVVRITDAASGDSTQPSLNELGNIVVFQSTATLGGVANPSGIPQLFVYERRTNLLRQITFGQAPSINPVPNASGNLIVFQSRADLLGSGGDTGVWQIYLADYNKATHTATITRLTNGDADSVNPWISEVEKWVAFESSATNLGGTPGANQIYLAHFDTIPPTIRQLTDQASYGDCHAPSIDVRGRRVAFVCTGDPLQNGTVGNRLFVFDTEADPLIPSTGPPLRQITGTGDVIGPVSQNLGLWFLTFATTADLDGQGACGSQLWALNYFDEETGHWRAAQAIGELPPDLLPGTGGFDPTTNLIGRRTMVLQQGNGVVGSAATITTSLGSTTVPLSGDGILSMVIGAPDEFTGLSSVNVLAGRSSLPPVPLPGIGAMCLTPVEDGAGILSCLGGQSGGDITTIQDHNTDDADPACVLGCREDNMSCQGGLTGPHRMPGCLTGSCGVCNGRIADSPGGAFLAGGMRVTLPLVLDVSVNPGFDGIFCTNDDVYGAEDVDVRMTFNTGRTDGVILDADNVPGATLLSTDTGAPFNCVSLHAGVMFGAALVGTLPVLDLPNVPQLRDALVRLRLEPRIEPSVCEDLCTSDVDCDDGNPCNGGEFCVSGVCLTGSPIVCDDGDVCNGLETCDPATGACLAGAPCDDGDPCNGTETCDAVNGCQPGTPVVCTDGDACNGEETCDPATGSCLPGAPPVCDDGDVCNGIETCDPVAGCQPGTPIVCSDGNACNGDEVCDPLTGACGPGVPPVCDDGNPCTDDGCDSATGCFVLPNTDPCDDGSLCTTGDTCDGAGACVGTPILCDDGDACNGFEDCDPLTGTCAPGVPPVCDDGNPCTDDGCDSATGCFVVPNTNPCDDGSLCTTGDTCDGAGACVGTPILCDDGDACNGLEACDPLTGTCVPGVPPVCDDANPCTDDGCDSATGCFVVPNTAPCDDGSACTTGDTCDGAGACVGTPLACDDGDACNGQETCDPGLGCLPGAPLVCDDNNPCTDDGCDSATGCFVVPNTDPCDDGDLCTTNDTCSLGNCVGVPVVCDDADVCNGVETCDPATGTCLAGTGLTCDDGNPCTDDICDPLLGCQHPDNTAPCDDGNTCTNNDTCGGGICAGTPDVMCSLSALEATILGAAPEDFGSARRQRRLLRMALKARTRTEAALFGNPLRASRNLKRAAGALERIVTRTAKWMNRGKVVPALGDEIVELATAALTEVQRMLVTP